MDLTFLSHLYAVSGPYATVYVATTGAAEDAAKQLDLRWRALRDELAAAGADERTIDAIGDVLRVGEGGSGQAVVAAQGRVLLDQRLPFPPRQELAHWGPLPHVMPLVSALSDAVPHVVVVVDRIGADITAYGDHGEEAVAATVVGQDDVIRKVGPGGWSQRRFQQRAEDSWNANAKDVVERVNHLCRLLEPQVIVLAGDVRARQMLRENLPKHIGELIVEVDEGGRGPGASVESFEDRIAKVTAEVAAHRALDTIAEFEEELGQQDRAVESLDATVEALRRAQVQTLVIDDDPTSTLTLWVGESPALIAVDRQELVDLGVDSPRQVRADAALVGALVATAGDLVIVPGGTKVTEGVGAILRYADAAAPG